MKYQQFKIFGLKNNQIVCMNTEAELKIFFSSCDCDFRTNEPVQKHLKPQELNGTVGLSCLHTAVQIHTRSGAWCATRWDA